MGREPLLQIVIGRKGVGKTYTTMKYLRRYVAGNPSAGVPGRKVLIFDTNNEYSDKSKYPDIRAIGLKDVARFSIHPQICIRRVQPFLPNGEEMTPDQKSRAVLYILSNFRNGLILLEDLNSYIGDYIQGDVIGVILSQRHKGIDTILHYHSFGRVQKKIWPHVNVIRMHRSNDSVLSNAAKFQDKFECFKIAENIVNSQFDKGNNYFYLHINNDLDKIFANISLEDREAAVMDYIGMYNNQLINPLLNMRDVGGTKKHTYATALEQVKSRIVSTYFSDGSEDK